MKRISAYSEAQENKALGKGIYGLDRSLYETWNVD